MVDVNLLHGTYLTQQGGDSLELGIEELMQVVQQATPLNRAKAYHQLALTYLERNQTSKAETMLDSMYVLLHPDDAPTYIRIDFHAILNHYLKTKNQKKVAQYTRLLLQERQALKEKQLSFNIIQSIVDLQTEQKQQELTLVQLRQTNQLLLLLCSLALATIIIAVVLVFFMKQRRKHDQQLKQADAKLTTLVTQLQQSNAEREIRAQELRNILDVKDQRQELETLTPSLLQTSGETKFRQCFELLHPLFLPRLREKVPTITRREELLSMLIVLQQDNKRIAELLAIAPRSVLMLRHRFRQKLGIHSERTLENFIEEVLNE
jgi:DNA-binding CsgD family transcriptional regulator